MSSRAKNGSLEASRLELSAVPDQAGVSHRVRRLGRQLTGLSGEGPPRIRQMAIYA